MITDAQRTQWVDDGYFILENVISAEHLDMLRAELDRMIAVKDAEMDARGVDTLGISQRGNRYFISGAHLSSDRLPEFLFSDVMAEICTATIGPDAWLIVEQFAAKMADVGMKFSWHQDSGYLKSFLPDHKRPYVTCWCALDDMSVENGTIWVLPYSSIGSREVAVHQHDPESNDLVGYTGDEPGVPVTIPAGSIAVFESTVFHRSGPNTTNRPRRSYVAQYSPERVLNPDGTPWNYDERFLAAGTRVR